MKPHETAAERNLLIPIDLWIHDADNDEKSRLILSRRQTKAKEIEVATMRVTQSKMRASAFAIAFLSFWLPFVEVACLGMEVRVSGIQLATGVGLESAQGLGAATRSDKYGGEATASLAFVCALLGLVVTLFPTTQSARPALILAVVGLVSLATLPIRLSGQAQKSAAGIVRIRYHLGYGLAVAGFGAVMTIGPLLARLEKKRPGEAVSRATRAERPADQ